MTHLTPAALFLCASAAGLLVCAAAANEPDSSGVDLLGEKELAGGVDPSFASVSRHFPAMKWPREAIGVKEAPTEIAVHPDGSLFWIGRRRGPGSEIGGAQAFFVVGAPPVRLGAGDSLCRKRLLGGCLPIIVFEWERDGVKYEETVTAWSEGMSPDAPQSAWVSLKVLNATAQAVAVSLRFQVQAVASADMNTRAVEMGGEPATAAEWRLELGPGSVRNVCVKTPIPLAEAPETISDVTPAEFESRLKESTAFWERTLAKGMRITVPEQRVNDAYRAWLAYNFINVDKRDGIYEPHDGAIGFYEAIFGYSAALYCHALDLMGYPEEAGMYLDSLFTFLSPEGLFIRNFGLCDTGALLYAAAQHFLLARDEAWLRTAAPFLVRMCEWTAATRKQVMAAQEKDSPIYGLLKFKPYADYPGESYCYLTDCYLVAGMGAAAEAIREIGMSEQAARILRECAAYRQDIQRSMERAVIERDGLKMLPLFPENHELLKQGNYKVVNTYYNLVAGMVLESGVLPPGSIQARWLTTVIEQRKGLSLGAFAHGEGLDHAYSYGYWMDCLQRDEVGRVLLGFYTTLAYCTTRETHCATEYAAHRTGESRYIMPDLYSNTQQLRLLRHMLVREEGDTLLIGQATPRPWLEDGEEVRVERAPTLFGETSFTIASHAAEKRITVTIDPPVRRPPAKIIVRLRHPRGEPIRAATLDGRPIADFTADTVTLTGASRRTVIEARY
ncbi:MAG: hypothetical protein HY321_05845 [Armatimonadetes bacterium]|nr:hypothetical protein [Armatimonadota bacterium]